MTLLFIVSDGHAHLCPGGGTVLPSTPTQTQSVFIMAMRRWCFTVNNYCDADINAITEHANLEKIHFAVVGKEVGESGTPHLQGFINFKRTCRLAALKKILPTAHFEPVKGTDQDNDEYCSKDQDLLLRIGEPSRPGKRNDLLEGIQCAKKGGMDALWREHPATYVRYYRGIENGLQRDIPRRRVKTEVLVLVGPPGCGKSHYAEQLYPNAYYKDRGEWWCNYQQEEAVIMDEFYGWIRHSTMLRLMNSQPMQVQSKGGNLVFNSKHIVICSNKHVDKWYKFEDYTPESFMRRITQYLVWDNGKFIDYVSMYPINHHMYKYLFVLLLFPAPPVGGAPSRRTELRSRSVGPLGQLRGAAESVGSTLQATGSLLLRRRHTTLWSGCMQVLV